MADYEKLFDFDDDFDVNLLESIAVAASSPKGQTHEMVRRTNTRDLPLPFLASSFDWPVSLTVFLLLPSLVQFTLANTILDRFRQDPRAWTRVPTILEHAQHPQTKRFALSVMECLVLYRWNSLPPDQQMNIREYMISYVMELSSTPDSLQESKLIRDKANGVVVSVRHQFLIIYSPFGSL